MKKKKSKDEVIAEFRANHPECENGFRISPKLGLAMNTETAHKFIAWCVANGYATNDQAKKTKSAMQRSLVKPENN